MKIYTNSAYYRNLIQRVIDNSEAPNWENAVLEWEVIDCEEDGSLETSCVCGKEQLRYLFTIRNTLNGRLLYPIGSSCIKKFGRLDFDEEVTVKEQLFKLLHAIENNAFLTLSSDYFSRKLLHFLYNLGAFRANEYNNFVPYNDYQFMLDMFNKRSRTALQDKKATAIILNAIRPFLWEMLSNKIR